MEIWKDIPNYEGIYQASSEGEIRSVEGKTTYSKLRGERRWKSRILKGRGNNLVTGKRVNLWKDGKCKEWLVARLVAITFLGNPPEGYTVNHKDGNRLNNCIENLEWLSRADNIRHGFNTGLYKNIQNAITLCDDKNTYNFNSHSEASRFLGRSNGYVNNALKHKRQIKDMNNRCYIAKLPF